MVNTRLFTSLSTAESYASRAEAAAATAFDRTKAKGATIEESTAAARAEATEIIAPIAINHGKTQTPAAKDYLSSFSKNEPPPLEHDTSPDGYYLDEDEGTHRVKVSFEGANISDATPQPLSTSPE